MKNKTILWGIIIVILLICGVMLFMYQDRIPAEYGKDCVKVYEGPFVGVIEKDEGIVVVVRDLDTEELSYILFTDEDFDTKLKKEPEVVRIIRGREYGKYLGVCTEYSSILEAEGAYMNGYPLAIAWVYEE